MKIKNVKLSTLIPYENNPRNNEGAVQSVANSIKTFGFKVPIVIDKNNVIVAGHTRYKASQLLGLEEVPVIVADDLTPEQVKAFRIADNKTGEKASWDYNKLGKEVEELTDIDLGIDLQDLGFADFELSVLLGDYEPEGFDDELTEQYEGLEENSLKMKRIIITYDKDSEGKVLQLLKLEKLTKIRYDIGELL